jgi:hypothetical protein
VTPLKNELVEIAKFKRLVRLTSVRVKHDLGLDDLAALREEVLKVTLLKGARETRDVQVVTGVVRDRGRVVTREVRILAVPSSLLNLPATGGIATTVTRGRRAAAVTAGRALALTLTRVAVVARLAVLTASRRGLAVARVARVAVVGGRSRVLPDCGACQASIVYRGRSHGEGEGEAGKRAAALAEERNKTGQKRSGSRAGKKEEDCVRKERVEAYSRDEKLGLEKN